MTNTRNISLFWILNVK